MRLPVQRCIDSLAKQSRLRSALCWPIIGERSAVCRGSQRILPLVPRRHQLVRKVFTIESIHVRHVMTMTTASEVKHDIDDHAFYMQIQKGTKHQVHK